jgi:TolB protein
MIFKINKLIVFLGVLSGLCCGAAPSLAQLRIEVVGGGASQIPIAIVAFKSEEGLNQRITPVVSGDLVRSGLFKSVDVGGINPPPSEPEQMNYPQWAARGAQVVVIGAVSKAADGRYDIRFRVMDVAKQSQIAGYVYYANESQLRQTAHKIADVIYEKLTGDPGVFSTQIAYVAKRGYQYQLQVADADGFGGQSILTSTEPIMSLSWSPDGQRLAYVSFEQKKPIVYVQSMRSGGRIAVAAFRGSNSAPAWSPDGRRLAVTLTRDGGSQLFLVNADGTGGAQRLSQSSGIDTEANFAPDGQSILFTSDRGGGPQIYRMSVNGGAAQRVTFEGNYNTSPRHSPDGKSFAFVQRSGGRFSIAIQDIATRQVQVLTDGSIDESPSFAPNGKTILYATEVGGRGVLAAVSSDGRVKQRFSINIGDAREPAWSPLAAEH